MKTDKQSEKVRIKVIPTEIYSRVVGYFRPTFTWNEGKVEEFNDRIFLDIENERIDSNVDLVQNIGMVK